MKSTSGFIALLALASTTVAHVQINFPKGEWNHTEDAQETGAFCGGGTRGASFAWGLMNAFISLSGDEGNSISVRWKSGSASDPPSVQDASSFDTTLLSNATFPSSGNFCFNVTIPNASSLATGTRATLFVEASGDDERVSSCADVSVVPSLSVAGDVVKSEDGEEVINPTTNQPVTYFEYYCSNSTILALDTCDCHCHGDHEHCSDECSPERVAQAHAQCVAQAAGSSLPSSASSTAVSASGVSTPASSATSASSSPNATSQPSGAGPAVGGVSAVVGMLAAIGMLTML